MELCQYGPWLASPLCGVDRVCALVGERTPPRRARGQPLHPIQALSPLDEAQTEELTAGVERAFAALQPKEAQTFAAGSGSAGGRGPEPARSRSARKLKELSHRRLKREAERKRGRSP